MASAVVAVAAFVLLCVLERLRPLRPRVEPGGRRVFRNGVVWAVSAAVLAIVDRPITSLLAEQVEARGFGLLPALGLPPAATLALGLVLLDYTIFVWHALLHRVPLLWRFHQVHHSDLDLDVSTALRFHAGELAFSVFWRCAQIAVLGIGSSTLRLWHSVLFVSVLFHHSNVRLPSVLERVLSFLVMTPRLHGIHHSIVPEEMNSNLSSGLAFWDVLHHTRRVDVSQPSLTIGLPEPRTHEQLRLTSLLAMPFRRSV